MEQKQFLNLTTAEEAERIFWQRIQPEPIGEEEIPLKMTLNRVLSRDVVAKLNIPFFDRSNFDGYAVRAEDTFGAEETAPLRLTLNAEVLACGVIPNTEVKRGTTTPIATGGVIPRGANAVLMVENSRSERGGITVLKSVVPGEGISFAGSDVGADEIVLRKGAVLTSRETGTLAAIGEGMVWVWKKPRVAILSTGDEIIEPGEAMEVGRVYDANSTVVAHAVEEIGCEPLHFGIIADDEELLVETIEKAMQTDFIILSGGTSKGAGDLNYHAVQKIGNPGIIIHGVALKPGKPLCLALLNKTPVAILPGFPTSAFFTFTKFVAPILRVMAGYPAEGRLETEAAIPIRINSSLGRTEFDLISLVRSERGYSAYSMGKGSGSITTYAKADGFVEIPRQTEMLEAGTVVKVQLLGKALKPADLVIIGSHCVGVDYLIGLIQREGHTVKFIPVGSTGGVMAIKRGECDLAGTHLMDEQTGEYNRHLLNEDLELIKGYKRKQGVVYRLDDIRFRGIREDFPGVIASILSDSTVRMINRNRGAGTRILLDQILNNRRPPGYLSEVKSHNAVAATIAQKRADWGMAIQLVAEKLKLGFCPYKDEEYDFLVLKRRRSQPAVHAFIDILKRPETEKELGKMGLIV